MKESYDIKSLNINVPKKSHFTSKGNLYHCTFDLITNKRLSETERTVIQQLIKNNLLLTENDSKSTVSNLIKMCEDYQFEIARLKKELREKKSDEDFVPLRGIIKSEDDEYLFVQYDILGIIKIPNRLIEDEPKIGSLISVIFLFILIAILMLMSIIFN